MNNSALVIEHLEFLIEQAALSAERATNSIERVTALAKKEAFDESLKMIRLVEKGTSEAPGGNAFVGESLQQASKKMPKGIVLASVR